MTYRQGTLTRHSNVNRGHFLHARTAAESTTLHNGSVCLCGSVCLMALWEMGAMKDEYKTFN